MLSEVGSNFWLNPDEDYSEKKQIDLSKFGIQGTDCVCLSSGRSAISYVLNVLNGQNIEKIALIPPYTCNTVVQPFIKYGYHSFTYTIDSSLNTTPKMLRNDIEKYRPSVVLLHRYFGFDTLKDCQGVIKEYSEKGIIFIEDRTQNIFSHHPLLDVNYIIGSLRKWLGTPDGGYAVCSHGNFSDKPQEYNKLLTQSKMKASFDKYEFLFHSQGSKDVFLNEYAEAERILGAEDRYYRISPVSENVFVKANHDELMRKRIENYNTLWHGLQNVEDIHSVFGKADNSNVPLYFVVWVQNRSEMQIHLRKHQIYAPIVWPKFDKMPEICEIVDELYQHLLCIPVDQRYDFEDMKRVISVIKHTRQV